MMVEAKWPLVKLVIRWSKGLFGSDVFNTTVFGILWFVTAHDTNTMISSYPS
jgi:hypothetical protein